MQDFKSYTIWNGITPKAITSSTSATPVVMTVTSHGYSTGDVVQIFGHTTNTAANGIYQITKVDANSFSLQNYNTGANIAGNGTGGATGSVITAPKIVSPNSYEHAVLEISSSGTATLTAQILGANGTPGSDASQHGDTPNLGATISSTNNYSFIQAVSLSDNYAYDGATGIVASGSDIAQVYKININNLKYLTLAIKSWTAGAITARINLYTQD